MKQPAATLLPQIVEEIAHEQGHSPLIIESTRAPNFVLVSEARYNQLLAAEDRVRRLTEDPEASATENARLLAEFEGRSSRS